MNVLIILSLLAIYLTYLEEKGKVKNGMAIGFFIISVVLSLRYYYGSDYPSYLEKYEIITSATGFYEMLDYIQYDKGWAILNYLFKPFGFQALIAVLTFFNSFVYYRLIECFVPKNLRCFALFIYLFSNSFFVVQISALRQTLAMALILFSLPDILNRKSFWKPLILICLAVSIHSTAIIAILFVFLPYIPFEKPGLLIIAVVSLFILFFFARGTIENWIMATLSSDFGVIEHYGGKYMQGNMYEVSEEKNILGLAIILIPIAFHLIYLCKEDASENIKALSLIYVFGAFIGLLNQVIPMVERLSWYYTVVSVVSIPIVYSDQKTPIVKYALISLFVLVTLKEYTGFFYSDTWKDSYQVFHTILSK